MRSQYVQWWTQKQMVEQAMKLLEASQEDEPCPGCGESHDDENDDSMPF